MGIGGIILVLFAIRALASATNSRLPSPTLFSFNFAWFAIFIALAMTSIVAIEWGATLAWVATVFLALLAFPDWLVLPLSHRLRWSRLTFVLAWMSPFFAGGDRIGSATAASALTWLRSGRPEPVAERIEAKLQRKGTNTIRGGGTLAAGFLAWGRGDIEQARSLFALVHHFDRRVASGWVRRHARRWLVMEAAERGDWRSISELAKLHRYDGVLRFAQVVARAELGEPVAAWRLAAAWCLCGRWLTTWGWFRDSWRRRGRVAPTSIPALTPSLATVATLRASLIAHPTVHAMLELTRTYEALVDSETLQSHVHERAAELDARDAQGAIDALHADIVDTLCRTIRSGVPIPATVPRTLAEARQMLSDERYQLFDESVDQLEQRVQDRSMFRSYEELLEWARYHTRYRELLASIDSLEHGLVFERMHYGASNHAANLFNDHDDKALGLAMMRWLYREAKQVEDHETVALHRDNLRNSPLLEHWWGTQG